MAKVKDAMPDLQRDLSFKPVENDNPTLLSKEQIEQYNSQGFVFPLDVFSAEEAAANRAFFDDVMQRAEAKGWNSYSINGWHKHLAGLFDLVCTERIGDYVSDLVGDNLICWGTHFFCKEPGDTKRVSWHQDASYWPLTPSRTVTVWLAIDDVDEENGAMRVIPATHNQGQIAFERSSEDENNVLNQTVTDAEAFGEPVSICLKAGQMSMHADLILHGSEPNPSSRRRCGLTMRFVPPEVQALQGWNGNAILVRGEDTEGNWAPIDRPQNDRIPDKPSK